MLIWFSAYSVQGSNNIQGEGVKKVNDKKSKYQIISWKSFFNLRKSHFKPFFIFIDYLNILKQRGYIIFQGCGRGRLNLGNPGPESGFNPSIVWSLWLLCWKLTNILAAFQCALDILISVKLLNKLIYWGNKNGNFYLNKSSQVSHGYNYTLTKNI